MSNKELSQNAYGVQRATRMSGQFLCCLRAHVRALCTHSYSKALREALCLLPSISASQSAWNAVDECKQR